MKQFLLSALLLSATLAANAQVMFKGYFHVVPKDFTKSGKPVPAVYDNETGEIKILNSQLATVKQFNLGNLYGYSKQYREKAVLEPTGASISWCSDREITDNYGGVELSEGSVGGTTRSGDYTATDLLQVCKTHFGTGYDWVTFTDSIGRISCSHDFFDSQRFGEKYPATYYWISDNTLWETQCRYSYTVSDEAMESANWIKDGEELVDKYEGWIDELSYFDYDANVYTDDALLLVTQTFFNDDDKWEYLAPLYGPNNKTYTNVQIRKQGTQMTCERTVYEDPTLEGIAIYNEDRREIAEIKYGKEISDLYIYDVMKLDGKIFIRGGYYDHEKYVHYDVVYLYDPVSTNVTQVSCSRSERFCTVEGRTVNFTTDDETDAVLFNMNGVKVGSAKAAAGKRTSINAHDVPRGVYNAALMKNGKVKRTQKVILK